MDILKMNAQEKIKELEDKYNDYFGQSKGWSKKLYHLLKSSKRFNRKYIEVINERIYFMCDQIARLETLGIIEVDTYDKKAKPLVILSNLYEGEPEE